MHIAANGSLNHQPHRNTSPVSVMNLDAISARISFSEECCLTIEAEDEWIWSRPGTGGAYQTSTDIRAVLRLNPTCQF